jgi:hypothetical protein
MYTEILRSGDTNLPPLSLASERKWHFDDQGDRSVYRAGIVLRSGDVVQSTCIMDTRGQSGVTFVGIETTDEMCWQQMKGWSTDGASIDASCAGDLWTGALDDEEIAYGIAQRHPSDMALNVWDGTDLRHAGAQVVADGMTVPCRNVNERVCAAVLPMVGTQIACDGDLGQFNKMLSGRAYLDMCCASACFSTDRCKSHRTCQAKVNESVAVAQPSKELPTYATYRVEAPSCANDDGFQLLDLSVFFGSTTTDLSVMTSTRRDATTTTAEVASSAERSVPTHLEHCVLLVLLVTAFESTRVFALSPW